MGYTNHCPNCLIIKQMNNYTHRIPELLENQSVNLFLWVPFLMALGGALYFNLSFEPNIVLCLCGMAVCIAGIMFISRIPILLRVVLLFVFGFCYAAVFTYILDTPQLPRDMHGLDISGVVEHIDYTADKSRIYLRVNADDINAGDGDAVVRVSARSDITPPNIGDTIRAKIGLFRPSGADAPESFDYARWSYFNGLTATGYLNSYDVVSRADYGGIAQLRNYIHNASDSFLVDTLVLGYKNAVPENDAPVWTATGVGHVWSISGFHITLVSAWLFAIFYLIFRSIAPITRRIPARVPALICAWAGLLFYLFLSGCDVATVRAFLMATLVFAAFIFGRNAISMRNVCIAFCAIFLMNPHYVMQPGFQLSFAAIFGLVWLWNDVRPRLPHNKILKLIYTAILTSLVATIFTAPFVVAHFNSLPIYGLVGNLILLPIFSVAIMPLVMIGVFCALFGWMWPTSTAEYIYDITLNMAHKITALPYATITLPHVSNLALCIIVIGLACMMFIRPIKIKVNYILCVILVSVGIIIIASAPRPIFYATADHELVAFMGKDGHLEFSKSRASNHYFTFDTWKQFNGEDIGTKNKRRKPIDGIWIYETPNFTLAYIQKFVPLMNNITRLCNDDNIDYIMSYFDVNAPQCNNKILRGGVVIYESGRLEYIKLTRPWHSRPE